MYVTKEDIEMLDKAYEWKYMGDDGCMHLREDAPAEIKAHFEKMKKKCSDFSFEKSSE